MIAEKPKRLRAWVAAGGIVIVLLAIIAIKNYYDTVGMPWTLITPSQDVEVVTRMAQLRNEGRFDQAVELGLHSAKGQPGDDFIFQMIATTYFVRALHNKDQSGQWTKLGGDYSEKALDFNPTDVTNVFNVAENFMTL